MLLDWNVIGENLPFLLEGILWTGLVAAVSIALGFLGGLLIGMGRISKNFLVNGATTVYVEASLNSAAYQAEIFRSGVKSISKGQMEASRAMGLTHNQTLSSIIIPQALRNALPAYTNEFITMIKDSSLVMIIGVLELTMRGKIVIAWTFQPFVVYIFVAIIYFIITFTASRLLRQLERRSAIPGLMGED
jgi:ABC-type amino acid transport system permease subunit